MAADADIRRLEELSANAWPAFVTVAYDGWLVRFADGYTKRANSVLPLYPSSIDLPRKVTYCRDYYRERGLPAVFKMTDASLPASLDSYLAGLGFRRVDESSLQVLRIDRRGLPGRRTQSGVRRTIVEQTVSEAWIDGFLRCSRIDDPARRELIGRFARSMRGTTVTSRVEADDEIVGCALGVIDDGWVGVFDVVVDPAHRRRGVATQIMQSLIEQSVELGASSAYLQVLSGNDDARRLYAGLGFSERYRYWYRSSSAK